MKESIMSNMLSDPVFPAAPESEPLPRSDIEKVASNASNFYYSTPTAKKYAMVFAAGWVTLSATFSSTSLLVAAQEIADEFGSTTSVVNLSTGGLLLAMGLSSFIWGPISEVEIFMIYLEGLVSNRKQIIGRRWSYNACIAVLLALTCGAAASPNMKVFMFLRILSGFQGTFFHTVGQTIIAEYFAPVS
jgi:MFS family permease